MVDNGVADLSSEQVTLFTMALAAVLDHDRDQVPTGSTGEIILGGGRRASYRLNSADPPVDRHIVVGDATGTRSLSIDDVLNVFFTESSTRLSERTMRVYVSVLELLRACLNHYGYQLLSESEERQFQAAYAAGDEQAFCRLFGPDKLAENLNEFLGHFMIRKVIAGPDLQRASGTVTGKLVAWLAERG